jgi:hypothetical protein
MRTATIALAFASVVYGGSVDLVTGDLSGGTKALDNIKAKWSQSLKVLGNAATVTGSYDRSENENFLNEATLTGSVGKGKVDYELTTKFGSGLDYQVSTTTDDGSSISAEGSVDLLSASDLSVRKVSASSTRSLRGNDYDIELSHDLSEGESKIKMSTVLGAGVKAVGTLSNKGGATSKGYEIEYDTTLNDGRTLSASVNPDAGTGEIEYTDSSTFDGTVTANIPLGGSPSVTFKRSFGF